uniref:ATP synthase complex subunit 8 n=1 Tax=Echinocardium cordatum TaxID=39298 RepID=D3H5Z5_ECHCD|nr:ATP synthase F0 subunit 8 [Echinocardium cordatum]CBH40169.1 ATPase subunit 8 [Echinocardium cordatum]
MPQLDFTWWIINFFLIWTSIVIVLLIVTANIPPQGQENESSSPLISKETTEWQWL